MQIDTTLFDFDGVIADTEDLYARFFHELEGEFPSSADDLAASVKGVTLPEILTRFYGDYPGEIRQQIAARVRDFETRMDYRFIPGAREFLLQVKRAGYRVGLVTSSGREKMRVALAQMQLESTFDAVITSELVTRGKPHPMCYLEAAARLSSTPATCVVFEDSIAGLSAGRSAGMTLVALATTLPASRLRPLAPLVVPDFTDPAPILDLLAGH